MATVGIKGLIINKNVNKFFLNYMVLKAGTD